MFGWLKKIWVKKVAEKPLEILRNYGQARSGNLPEGSLRVMTWNAYKAKGENFADDAVSLQSQADIFCMQECSDSYAMLKFLEREKAGVLWHMAVCFWGPKHVATGPATGSYAAADKVSYELSDDREPFIQTPKAMVMTHYKWGGLGLLVINIHGLMFTNTDKWKRQLEQAASQISAHKGPVIFIGDFNVRNNKRDKALREFAFVHRMTHINELEDLGARRYDRVLTRGVNVTSVKVLKGYKSSNHLPIVIEIVPEA